MLLPIDPQIYLPLTGKRIVIVEDEGIVQMQLRKILTRAGLLVVGSATNGKEGVEVVLRERPDIVLMDITMPVMNGLDAAAHILAEYLPFLVFLTAYSDDEYQEKARQLGARGYIIKPITGESLLPQLLKICQPFS